MTLPRPLTSGAKAAGRFGKQDFVYLPDQDAYRCPAGAVLPYHYSNVEKGMELRRYWSTAACLICPIKRQCTTSKERRIRRWRHEHLIEDVQRRVDENPDLMGVRRETVEHPFGTIKARMGATHFLMKRLPNVAAEMALHVAYNLTRVMKIIGKPAVPLRDERRRTGLPSVIRVPALIARSSSCWPPTQSSHTAKTPCRTLGYTVFERSGFHIGSSAASGKRRKRASDALLDWSIHDVCALPPIQLSRRALVELCSLVRRFQNRYANDVKTGPLGAQYGKIVMQALIMAGGLGARLRPFTITVPKPLLPLGDQPIVDVLLGQLHDEGFERVCVCIGYMAPLFQAFLGDGSRYGLKIDYFQETVPLGTAGALSHLDDLDENFLVMNGDTLTDISFRELLAAHVAADAIGTVFSARVDENIDYGLVEFDPISQLLVRYTEKPTRHYHVSTGIYALSRRILDYAHSDEGGRLDMPDLLRSARNAGQAVLCYTDDDAYWRDIGRFDHYEAASKDFHNDPARFRRRTSDESNNQC